MPTLNFQARFADSVESGAKRQTIRKLGKRRWKAGDIAYLHTGQRLKHGDPRKRFLGVSVITQVHEFIIDGPTMYIDDIQLTQQQMIDLARDDGFGGKNGEYSSSVMEMRLWFFKTHGFPFIGQLIKWDTVPSKETRK